MADKKKNQDDQNAQNAQDAQTEYIDDLSGFSITPAGTGRPMSFDEYARMSQEEKPAPGVHLGAATTTPEEDEIDRIMARQIAEDDAEKQRLTPPKSAK